MWTRWSKTIREDLARESAGIDERLASLERALLTDNRFRLAAVAGVDSERNYLLDYAATAMRLTGLSMLQIQDGDGRILSSGHFRNEHGRVEPGLASALHKTPGVSFVKTRGPEKEFLALARAKSFEISGRAFTIIGGVVVDAAWLERLARDRAIAVSLRYPGGTLSTATDTPVTNDDPAVGELQLPVIHNPTGTAFEIAQADLAVTQSMAPLTDAAAACGCMVTLHRYGREHHRFVAGGMGIVPNQPATRRSCR